MEPQAQSNGMTATIQKPLAYDDSTILVERRRTKQKNNSLVWGLRVGVLGIFVAVWQFVTSTGLMDSTLVSTPLDVATAFIVQLTDSTFWVDVLATFSGALVGLITGAILGILSGVLFAHVPVLHTAAQPLLTLINSLPRPALAPIFILWFGLGFGPKALVAFSVVYFVLLTSTLGALVGIDHDIKQLTTSLGMSARQRFFKIEFPSALPAIVGGLRLGAVYSVLGAVVSEMVGSYTGLGQRLVVVTNNFHVDQTFAILLAMGLLSMLMDLSISVMEKNVSKRSR
ncbi:ABC transporter permease [Glutamicibacter sp.]|uniref:ABC transporter permease n=1 Tax=Glutamicibacter sp. TaxID=1931995 RepID=UPI002B45E18F|nr:ABC transporter permease [Glutamicibacter sp.]HJX79254.1 ABC transporter permease [Glutamicibacter sp.]